MSESLYTIEQVAEVTGGTLTLNASAENRISELLTDSRRLAQAEMTLFFAIRGERNDGHQFIPELLSLGVRNFIISNPAFLTNSVNANFILLNDALEALQKLTAFHRRQFHMPVIAITGSNGKTIVKEWLYQLLRSDRDIVRSPKSYNSQIGVPLSIWNIRKNHQLAIIEAGISKPGEMRKLHDIIQPTIGIFTNIGTAHDENFTSELEKVQEKSLLLDGAESIIYCKDAPTIQESIEGLTANKNVRIFNWSRKSKADLQIGRINKGQDDCEIQAVYNSDFISIKIPFTDDASVENAITCWCLMLVLEYDPSVISERMLLLSPVAMRLEMKTGINNSSVINDSYNSDLGSLTIALDFLQQQKQHPKRTVVLSDILQSGKNDEKLYKEVALLLNSKKIDRLIGIGPSISKQEHLFSLERKFFPSTEDFLHDFSPSDFRDETILIKGARLFGFEKISKALQQKTHETVLEIDLNGLVHNLNYYRSRMKPETKIMAMVKATAYGSGSFEIANVLQYHRADYLAVAFTDEGVELRKAGITLPIMVMNPEIMSFDLMAKYKLEPEIYSFRLLNQLQELLRRYDGEPFNIHLKLDTGMHRLGFEEKDLNELVVRLNNYKNIKVQSVYTHLAASDEPEHDGFTQLQINKFKKMSDEIRANCPYPVMRHVLNSSGILRFSEAQFEMVRIGIGLYGFAATSHEQSQLIQVATLRSTISQIKHVPANETVGYSRKGKLKRDSVIATVAIGYADGLNRRLGNGNGRMLVNGRSAVTVGNICMDMCMIDVTDVPAREGDEVTIFGKDLPVYEVANATGTIPYEILVNVSQRVKRIYYQE